MADVQIQLENLIDTLTEEDRKTALSFVEFLSAARQKSKRERNADTIGKIRALVSKSKPWASEADMLKEMAEFRRKRMAQ